LVLVSVTRSIEPKILLITELQVVNAPIETWLPYQLVVRTVLHDAPRCEHQNGVSMLQGAQPLRNDKRGAAGHEFRESLLNEVFGFHVHTRRRIIEDEQTRVTHKGPRNRNALALPA